MQAMQRALVVLLVSGDFILLYAGRTPACTGFE